jgi:hypothetical protein
VRVDWSSSIGEFEEAALYAWRGPLVKRRHLAFTVSGWRLEAIDTTLHLHEAGSDRLFTEAASRPSQTWLARPQRCPDSPFPQELTHHERMISNLCSKAGQTLR